MNSPFPLKDLFGNLSILVILVLIFAIDEGNSRYPDDCFVHDDKFCYNILNIPKRYTEARTICQDLGGVPDGHKYPDNVNKAIEERGSDIYWIFRSFESKYCYAKRIGTTAEFSCQSILPAICIIPLKNCTLLDLRLSIPNAEFENCKNSYLPSEDISINCRERYILHKSFPRCNKYGCRKANAVSCHFDGKWSNVPECKTGCLHPETHFNVLLPQPSKPVYDVGENVTLFCRENFISLWKHPVTSMVITCLDSGSWSNSMPSCMPVEHLSYHYDYFNYYHFKMKLSNGDKVKLNCTLETHFKQFQRLNKSVTWFRDQVELNSVKGGQIFFNETDFSLNLLNFSSEDEGIYMCIIEERSTSSLMSIPWSYEVSLARHCSQPISEHFLMLTLQEGTSKIVRCPANNYIYKVRWFKDGQRIWGSNSYILTPDGSLLFEKISKADGGTYVCTFNDIQSFCDGKSQILISVKPATECGTLERNSNGRPWLATLGKVDEANPYCYATLIKSNWLITAASCLVESDMKENPGLFVELGSTSQNAARYEIQEVKLHLNYSRRLRLNDVALIKLTNHVVFTDDIHPICFLKSGLHSEDYCTDFKSGTVTGFGHFSSIKGITNLKIKSEALNIVTKSECNKIAQNLLPEYMFCAKAMESSETFAGDSGSPFEMKWRNRWHLLGVMSWGDRAMKFGNFDYFSKLTTFQNWIQSTLSS